MSIDKEIENSFLDLIGKRCCRKRVGHGRSLSLGFGVRIPHTKSKAVDAFYGEWEIGTYSAAWRIVQNGAVICGSLDVVDSINELDDRLQNLELGAILSIEAVSELDIRVKLDNDFFIDFICVSAEDDEMFHIFGPMNLYVEYKYPDGWKVGKSNAPWG
ncbi:hypothetical protein [Hylemonella gracilis]|uniref:hypothetical protein n=1 Tax=Hylemonella gracilis TaxID=80880 RepID=UPI0011108B71|nr:hypothetical protein [Hylemonella gracilis]